jgi:hypothetical protein
MPEHNEEETNQAAVNNQKPRAANACEAIRPCATVGRAFLIFIRYNKAMRAPHPGPADGGKRRRVLRQLIVKPAVTGNALRKLNFLFEECYRISYSIIASP